MNRTIDVLLVYPPVMRNSRPTDPPFGLMYLAAVLRQAGIGVSILDLNALRWPDERVREYFRENRFQVVGIGGMTTVYYYVRWLAACIKEASPATKVIGGGSFATPVPETVLEHTALDAVCIGEGESVIVPLVAALLAGRALDDLPGIAFKSAGGAIVKTVARPLLDDLDALPWPAYDLVDMRLYLASTGKRPSLLRMAERHGIPPEGLSNTFIMFSARGCPFGCTFCYRNFGRQVRRHSVDYLLRHIRFAREQFGVNNIAFYDETFNASPSWVREFCRRSREELPETFFWMGGARADLLDDDLLVELKRARFYEVSVGVESFDDRILTEMGKRLDARTLVSSLRRLIAHDLAPSYLGMLYGFPGDDELSLRRSVDEICRLGIPAYFQFPLPFPGTILFERLRQEGRIPDVEQFMLRMADQMTQDLCVNLSRYPDEVLVRVVRDAEREIAASIPQNRPEPPSPPPANGKPRRDLLARIGSRARREASRAVRLLRRLAPRRPARPAGGVRVALVGNIANNAFNMVNILREEGVFAQLIDDGANNFAFSRPSWEESDVTLSYAEVMQSQRTLDEWRRVETGWGWQDGGRVIYPAQRGRLDSFVSRRRTPLVPEPLRRAIERTGLDPPCQQLLCDAAGSHGRTIEALRGFDVVVAFGFLAAACAYLAERPTLYFTYGGDCRVDLADRDGSRAAVSRLFAHILASDRFAIEGYGCDQEIHDVLRARGLLHKVAYGFLPNVNLSLFRSPWDRDAARAELGWPRDKLIFLLASRVDYTWKSADVFLDAFARFAADRDGVRLVVTGWGNDYRDARERIERQGLLPKVIFLEECYAKPALFRRYAAADVIVDQFKVGSLGSVSFEALCMGKPVLTYLAPFNLHGYPSPPPILNACTQGDILRQLESCAAEPGALARIGSESSRWYSTVYAPRNLSSCVKTLAESGPGAWVATTDFRNDALPKAELPVPDRQATVRILPWPYPFRAGFTLAGDCEYFCWSDFCTLGRWLTTQESTPLGPGLGLPASSSFWFFSEDPENLGFSYFEGDDCDRTSRYAPYLAELLKLGYLDTLHSYGGFDVRGGFQRRHAQAAVAELDRLGVRLSVWTNHGSALNVQNLGGRWANAYAQGDVPGSAAYHADLLPAAGFRYFWLDAFATNRFSLGNPQGRDFEDGLAARDPSPLGDRILCGDRLRDGREILAFRRFRGRRTWAPDPGSLAEQLSTKNLDHLESSGGAVVLYQHLGCFREADGRPVGARGRPLPLPAVRQLQDLAARYHAQRIWVAPCAAFLRYLETVGELTLDVDTTDEGVVLRLSGRRAPLEEKDLAGVSLSVRGRAGRVAVEIVGDGDRRTPSRDCQVRRINEEETIVTWPQASWTPFPFQGNETS